ncbi:phage-related protein [Geobacillus kaustophilus HTA426]|uniref:Putative HNH nuclease YajD n=2 Tax=Bacillales TaxID=1385 RepID=Q5L2L9_GEOKA|nr:phage-related protein [Geobacillus kaustophilus HTA426]
MVLMNNQQYYDKYKRNKEAKKFYNSTAWRKCREYVLKRDNYLCQRCLRRGIIQPADVVHHKEHLEDNPAKALDPENLESLCNACHNEEHPEKGQKAKSEKKTRKVRVIKSEANPLII